MTGSKLWSDEMGNLVPPSQRKAPKTYGRKLRFGSMADFVERVMEREASRSPLLRTVEPRREDTTNTECQNSKDAENVG